MTPHTRPQPPNSAGALLFACAPDGIYRAGPYTITPASLGFAMDGTIIKRDGAQVHSTAGRDHLEKAIEWAQRDAARRDIGAVGQQALI